MSLQRVCDVCDRPLTAGEGVADGKGKFRVLINSASFEVTFNLSRKVASGLWLGEEVNDVCVDCLRKKLRIG